MPGVVFLKVDCDEADDLAASQGIEAFPTVKVFRGDPSSKSLKGIETIQGGGPQFVQKFQELVQRELNDFEKKMMVQVVARALGMSPPEHVNPVMGTDETEVSRLGGSPLEALQDVTALQTRESLSLPPVPSDLAFDVSAHDAARSAVAGAMLSRMREDVKHWADTANGSAAPKMAGLTDTKIRNFLEGGDEAEVRQGREELDVVLARLQASTHSPATRRVSRCGCCVTPLVATSCEC